MAGARSQSGSAAPFGSLARACAVILAAWSAAQAAAQSASDVSLIRVELDGAVFNVTDENGLLLPENRWIGAELSSEESSDLKLRFRIVSVKTARSKRFPDSILYTLAPLDNKTAAAPEICRAGSEGLVVALPLRGAEGRSFKTHPFTLTCRRAGVGGCAPGDRGEDARAAFKSLRGAFDVCIAVRWSERCAETSAPNSADHCSSIERLRMNGKSDNVRAVAGGRSGDVY